MQPTAKLEKPRNLKTFFVKLGSPEMRQAAARGLNEHTEEVRRQSVTRMTSYTGVPRSRVAGKTKVIKARPSASMVARVQTADQAIGLHEYGAPTWTRDLKPGWKGGSVSSMSGAEATSWNIRRQFKGTFVAKGKVFVRTGKARDAKLKVLSGAVLANELSKPTRPNVAAAEKYTQIDLERRVMRHIVRVVGG